MYFTTNQILREDLANAGHIESVKAISKGLEATSLSRAKSGVLDPKSTRHEVLPYTNRKFQQP